MIHAGFGGKFAWLSNDNVFLQKRKAILACDIKNRTSLQLSCPSFDWAFSVDVITAFFRVCVKQPNHIYWGGRHVTDGKTPDVSTGGWPCAQSAHNQPSATATHEIRDDTWYQTTNVIICLRIITKFSRLRTI